MNSRKSNKKISKRQLKEAGLKSVTELARMVPCARPSIYFALEKPERYSRVYSRIKQLLAPKEAAK